MNDCFTSDWSEALEAYKNYVHNSDYANSTKKEYINICCDLQTRIVHAKSSDLIANTISDIAKKNSPSRARKTCIVMKKAMTNYDITEARDIVIPIQQKKARPIPTWTNDEYNFFISNANNLAVLIAKCAYLTGQRISDLVNIQAHKELLYETGDNGLFMLPIQQVKTGTWAYIPVTDELFDIIKNRQHGFLIHDVLGKQLKPTHAAYYIKSAVKKLDIRKELSIHGLRKLCAANMAAKGCTVYEIASVTGHLSMSNLSIYTSRYDRLVAAQNAGKKMQL